MVSPTVHFFRGWLPSLANHITRWMPKVVGEGNEGTIFDDWPLLTTPINYNCQVGDIEDSEARLTSRQDLTWNPS